MTIQFPNILLQLITYMTSHPLLTGFNTDRVAPNLNGYETGQRWVEVKMAPGNRVVLDRLDARSFDLNCYAEDLDSTLLLAERALAAALSMQGVHDDLVVTHTDVGITPFDLTDQLDNRYRFVSNVVIYFRPL
jgi:hypothetical protein